MLRALYLDLISAAATRRHLDQILAHTILSSHHGDLIFTTRLIHRLGTLSPSPAHLLRLFAAVPRPDLFLLNSLLRALPPTHSLPLLASLPRRHSLLRPNSFTFAFAVSAAASLPSPVPARALHAQTIVSGLSSDPFIGSALTNFYLNFSQPINAHHAFDAITEPDTVSWNTLISGLVSNGLFSRALKVFEKMAGGSNRFDSTTLAVVLPAAAELQELSVGRTIHCLGWKLGVETNSHVVTGLISMYTKCTEVSAAKSLFEEIERPDLVARNAMISGYNTNGYVECSVRMFKGLLDSGGKANSSTMVGLIPVFSPFGHEMLCKSLHGFCVKVGFDVSSSVSTALTTVYCRLNDLDSARGLFNAMSEKSMPSWNAMISGYAQNGLTEMAVSLFKDMQKLNVRPNPVTVTSILSACAQIGALTLGKWVHRIIAEEDVELNVYVLTALIDMYAKCGSIAEARRIFDSMEEKNEISWNAIISGYGLHGHSHEALRLFSTMIDCGIDPTRVTFLSVLHACSHGGLVEEGRKAFKSMVRDHGIKPGPEHYACMVDLLGRAGQLNEAYEFIKTLPDTAGPGIWGALLGACKKHKDTNLARVASDKLFELEPENPGYFVLLSNIYSENRDYSGAAAVRQVVKNRKLAKTPGCTLIEVQDVQYVFKAGDRAHPQAAAIYAMLETLAGKIAEAGYCAETEVAMYDVEEEEREQMVRVHSEKLAIAFGIMNTDPGSEIRIIKNLRVCLDCHNWTKFISKVTERLIVVRDANRFHHFEDGECSCGDYW